MSFKPELPPEERKLALILHPIFLLPLFCCLEFDHDDWSSILGHKDDDRVLEMREQKIRNNLDAR
jgi:hypothetical protein